MIFICAFFIMVWFGAAQFETTAMPGVAPQSSTNTGESANADSSHGFQTTPLSEAAVHWLRNPSDSTFICRFQDRASPQNSDAGTDSILVRSRLDSAVPIIVGYGVDITHDAFIHERDDALFVCTTLHRWIECGSQAHRLTINSDNGRAIIFDATGWLTEQTNGGSSIRRGTCEETGPASE